MKSVCKGCGERYTACWGSCQKYIDAKAAHEQQKKAQKIDKSRCYIEYGGITFLQLGDERTSTTAKFTFR